MPRHSEIDAPRSPVSYHDHYRVAKITKFRNVQCQWLTPFILSQKLLCPDEAILHMDAIRTFNGTIGTITAPYISDLPGQFHEAHTGLMIISAIIIIGQKSEYVRNGYIIRTFATALVTHAAIGRTDLFIHDI